MWIAWASGELQGCLGLAGLKSPSGPAGQLKHRGTQPGHPAPETCDAGCFTSHGTSVPDMSGMAFIRSGVVHSAQKKS